MASSSHDIGFKRATLILFNVPYWKCEEGESLTTWWARIALPEELRTSIYDDPDIIDFGLNDFRPRTCRRRTTCVVTCCR